MLYDAFKIFNDTPVEGRAVAFDPVKRTQRQLPPLEDSDAIALIDDLLDYYLDMPTYSLVELTHGAGTPWSRTVEAAEQRVNAGMKISDEMILKFFEGPAGRAPRQSRQRQQRIS